MSSLNLAVICGNLGKDAETRFTASGIAQTKFSVATTEKWTDKGSGEKKEETIWHNVVVWRREGLGKYLTKGLKVTVTGKIRNYSYDDKEGVKRYASEIVADEIVLMGGGNQQQSSGGDAGWGDGWSKTPPAQQQQAAAKQASGSASTATAVADDEFDIF